MPYPIIPLALCASILALAALRDLERRSIPNAVTGALLASGLLAQALLFGARAALAAAGAALVAGAVHALPWSFRLVGGGDVKLAAGAAAWAGLDRLLVFLLATALLGGVVSVAAAVHGLRARPRTPLTRAAGPRLALAHVRGIPVPYGVAIAAGALAALLWSPP